jgi:hypothetical protein
MSEDEIRVVFRHLAARLSTEDDLSDVTWAFIQSVPALGRDICRFLGGGITPEEPLSVDRECPIGNGYRVDFAFDVRESLLLVENKLWDRKYHLEQYAEAIRSRQNTTLCLLSNHRLGSSILEVATRYKWRVKYWDELVNFLSKQGYDEAQRLVDAYLAYVREVCAMTPIGLVRLEDTTLRSLVDLTNLIKKIIESSRDALNCKLHPSQRDYGSSWSGRCYSLEKTRFGKSAWPFFGVNFGETPFIVVALDEDWNPEIVRAIRPLIGTQDEFGRVEEYKGGGGIDFILLPERYRMFNSFDQEAQEIELRNFFNHVNRTHLGSA